MTTLSVVEHQRLAIGDGPGADLTEAQATALERLCPLLPPRAFSWERRAVRPGSHCGVVRVGDLTLEVLPKLAGHERDPDGARRCLVTMLRVAGECLATTAGVADVALQRHHLLDVFILNFCARANGLLHRGGPIRRYVTEEDRLPALRGRLHLPEQLRRSAANQARLSCRYDEFSVDNAHNRALKRVLAVMLNLALGSTARRAANGLLRRLEEVAATTVSAEAVSALPFDRGIAHWQPLFRWIERFLRGLHPDVTAGREESLGLLFDMNRLFERFAAAVLRRHWFGSGCTVTSQGPPRYFARAGDRDVFRLVPDVTVTDGRGDVTLICDAKWKVTEETTAGLGVAPGDVHQVASYASRYRCRTVALLYPCSATLPSEVARRFRLNDSRSTRVLVCGLDLVALTNGHPPPPELTPAFLVEGDGGDLAGHLGQGAVPE